MTQEQMEWIDNADYEQMLHKWRFAPIGDPYFSDPETWSYFDKIMKQKKSRVDPVAISKKVGWGDDR